MPSCTRRLILFLLTAGPCFYSPAKAEMPPVPPASAVFQYLAAITTDKQQSSQAFLWVPPAARQVRGVVVAGMTLVEREMVKDPAVRKACADEGLAILFFKCGLLATDVQKTLDELGAASGYRELSMAPLFFFGHSAGGPQAKALAIKFADRCFGVVQYRGGLPGGATDPVPPGVPSLMMVGQFDEFLGGMRDAAGREAWERARDGLLAFRAAADVRNLGSLIVEPGAGHFAWTQRNADYLATFLISAARARIPAQWPADAVKPVPCREVDVASGWLTDPGGIEKRAEFEPAAYAEYKGDKAKAAWHADEATARATIAYHAAGFGKQDQFIKWNDPTWVDAGVRNFFTELKWVDDGQTFKVRADYANAYPTTLKGGPRWQEAGKPVGHAAAPIQVRRVSGPVIATGPDTLRIQFDALAPAAEAGRVTFMAYSPGDADFRHTEQVGMMPRGFSGFTAGKVQTITFPPIGKLKVDGVPVDLKATSYAGLPVEYYVAVGPAVIENGKLRLAELPTRATFPVTVKVVAYQFGRGVEPLVKTAAPVEQTLMIEKP